MISAKEWKRRLATTRPSYAQLKESIHANGGNSNAPVSTVRLQTAVKPIRRAPATRADAGLDFGAKRFGKVRFPV